MSYTTYPLIINKTHWVNGSSFKYDFGNAVDMSDKAIALEKASMNFTWFNITSAKNNNTFSLIHPTNAGTTTLNITVADGGYNISDLDNYLRKYLVDNGWYIQNSGTLEQTVYAQFIVNPTSYKIQFVSYPLPTSLPSGYTAGSSITFPATAAGPQLVVPSNNFGTLIGFAAGTFPAVQPTSITTVSSTLTPIVNDVQSVVITLDSCFNRFASTNSNAIYSFTPAGVEFGALMTSEAKTLSFVPQQGFRNSILLTICDQYFRPLVMNDYDILITLQLRIENK